MLFALACWFCILICQSRQISPTCRLFFTLQYKQPSVLRFSALHFGLAILHCIVHHSGLVCRAGAASARSNNWNWLGVWEDRRRDWALITTKSNPLTPPSFAKLGLKIQIFCCFSLQTLPSSAHLVSKPGLWYCPRGGMSGTKFQGRFKSRFCPRRTIRRINSEPSQQKAWERQTKAGPRTNLKHKKRKQEFKEEKSSLQASKLCWSKTLPAHRLTQWEGWSVYLQKSKKTRTFKKEQKSKRKYFGGPVVPLRHSCPQLADKLQLSLPRHSPFCPSNTVEDTTVDVLIKVKIKLKILIHWRNYSKKTKQHRQGDYVFLNIPQNHSRILKF